MIKKGYMTLFSEFIHYGHAIKTIYLKLRLFPLLHIYYTPIYSRLTQICIKQKINMILAVQCIHDSN